MEKGSKKCSNCKAVNDSKANFCLKCGSSLDKDKVASVTDKKSVKNKENGSGFLQDKGNVMALVSLLLTLGIGNIFVSILLFLVSLLIGGDSIILYGGLLFNVLLPCVGVGIMVVGRKMYPDNEFLKVVMLIDIFFGIIFLLNFISLNVR